MNKVDKALQKLSKRERLLIAEILQLLFTNQTPTLDTKKLKGRSDVFRIRKDNLRIIYHQNTEGVLILAIERRNEKTYRNI